MYSVYTEAEFNKYKNNIVIIKSNNNYYPIINNSKILNYKSNFIQTVMFSTRIKSFDISLNNNKKFWMINNDLGDIIRNDPDCRLPVESKELNQDKLSDTTKDCDVIELFESHSEDSNELYSYTDNIDYTNDLTINNVNSSNEDLSNKKKMN